MSVDALEELAGWPDNENTFLVSGPDGVRLAVAPADVGGELGMMAALDWAYVRYGAAFAGSAEPVWRLRRWHGCRATGFADWIGDAEKFFGVSLADEKDVVYIVAHAEEKAAIMQAIADNAGPGTRAGAICFSLPISQVAGLRERDE